MALQGTFDTFPLPDVLSMLASTSKVGRLDVKGGARSGTLWVDGPAIVGAVCGSATDPVEVLVALLRHEDGEFRFDVGERPPNPSRPHAIDDALSAAAAHLAEWLSVEAVLPSPDHLVVLRRALPAPEVTISAPAWAGIVAIGGGGPVRELLARFSDVELDAARALVALVETGLLEVVEPVDPGGSWFSVAAPAPAPAPIAATAVEAPPSVAEQALEGEELSTGQPWRDQVRQLLGSAHAEDPPLAVAERFGPSHGTEPPAPGPEAVGPATGHEADGDRDVLLKFLGSVQK